MKDAKMTATDKNVAPIYPVLSVDDPEDSIGAYSDASLGITDAEQQSVRHRNLNGKAKRVVANRLSAYRARTRKRDYILDLEDKVRSLKAELSSMNSQIMVSKQDLSLLEIKNKKLREEIMIRNQNNMIIDAEIYGKSEEVDRMRKLCMLSLPKMLARRMGTQSCALEANKMSVDFDLNQPLGFVPGLNQVFGAHGNGKVETNKEKAKGNNDLDSETELENVGEVEKNKKINRDSVHPKK